MSQSTARAAERSATPRQASARERKHLAQKMCNHVAADLERALDGAAFVNYFTAGRLGPLDLSLLHPIRLARLRRDPRWAPPKGAMNVLLVYAMLIWRWRLPSEHAHAGERYSGVIASHQQMARVAGCHPDTWSRYVLPMLVALELVCPVPTIRRNVRARSGVALKHGDGRTLYVPGDALYELLGIRERRIERSRSKLIAEARLQLARGRKLSDPKALKISLSTREKFFIRARRRQPLAHTLARSYERPRRSVRPAAASSVHATPRTPVSTSPSTLGDLNARDDQRLVTKEARVTAAAGEASETPCSTPPAPLGDTNSCKGLSSSGPPAEASQGSAERPNASAPDDENADVRALLAALEHQLAPAGARAAPPPARSSLGRQDLERPSSAGEVLAQLAKSGKSAELVRSLRRASELEPRKSTARGKPAKSSAPATPAPVTRLAGLFGADERTPEERDENERRRKEALERARREANRAVPIERDPDDTPAPTDDDDYDDGEPFDDDGGSE